MTFSNALSRIKLVHKHPLWGRVFCFCVFLETSQTKGACLRVKKRYAASPPPPLLVEKPVGWSPQGRLLLLPSSQNLGQRIWLERWFITQPLVSTALGIGRNFKTFHPFFLSDKKIDGLGTHLFIDSSAYVLMRVRLFATPWIVAHQAPLSVEFSKQEHWSGLPFRPPGYLPSPGIQPASPVSAGRFFTPEPPVKALVAKDGFGSRNRKWMLG